MIFVDEIKEGLNIMLHPQDATMKEKSISQSLLFYYKVLAIPLAIYILLSFAFARVASAGAFLAWFSLLAYLVLVPIMFFFSAFLYHIFGKLFKVFKEGYDKTFTAVIYGSIPTIIFIWLKPIPIVSFLSIIFEIWGFIVAIFALSNQQKTSKLAAFGVILATGIVIAIIIILIGFSIISSLSILPAIGKI
jgi:hypothetical protein